MRKMMLLALSITAMMLLVSCEFSVNMTYEFSKSAGLETYNPTVVIFDGSDNYSVKKTDVMKSSILALTVSCFEGDKICWGAYSADLEWGCGKDCSKTEKRLEYCVECKKDLKIPATLTKPAPVTGTMTWTIVKEKNTANPIINFYDVDDAKKAVKTGVALDDATTTTSFTCTLGNIICIGADFEVAGEQFAIGCAEACADYEDYKTELTATKECQACVNGNAATVTYSNFLF